MQSDEIASLSDTVVLKYVKMVSNPLNLKDEDYSEYKEELYIGNTPMKGTSEHNTYAPRKRKATSYAILDSDIANENANKHDLKRANIEKRIQPMRSSKKGVIYVQKSGDDYITDLGNYIDADLIREIFDVEEVDEVDEIVNSRSKIGFIIEDYIADNLPCPYCGNKSLRSYFRKNMATVDLICISDDHDIDMWPIFFQVKASHEPVIHDNVIMGNSVQGIPYFTLNNGESDVKNTILTGSYREGNVVHNVNIDSSKQEKMLLMGYICIGYRDSNKGYEIIPEKSFMVLPNKRHISGTQLFRNSENKDTFYYRVLQYDKNKTLIEFSKQTNEIAEVPSLTIPRDYKGKWNKGLNPRRIISLEI
jgi:hypothetical protein